MSSYIVSEETINKIVSFIMNDESRSDRIVSHLFHRPALFGYKPSTMELAQKLATTLYDLNQLGFCTRYPNEEKVKYDITFKHTWSVSLFEAYDCVKTLRYQCIEGDTMETADGQFLEALYMLWVTRLLGM